MVDKHDTEIKDTIKLQQLIITPHSVNTNNKLSKTKKNMQKLKYHIKHIIPVKSNFSQSKNLHDKNIIDKKSEKVKVDEYNICPICLCDFNEYSTILDCNHKFHSLCILQWIQQQVKHNDNVKCPLCRKLMVKCNDDYDEDSDNEDEHIGGVSIEEDRDDDNDDDDSDDDENNNNLHNHVSIRINGVVANRSQQRNIEQFLNEIVNISNINLEENQIDDVEDV
jgi:hypothetical protein